MVGIYARSRTDAHHQFAAVHQYGFLERLDELQAAVLNIKLSEPSNERAEFGLPLSIKLAPASAADYSKEQLDNFVRGAKK